MRFSLTDGYRPPSAPSSPVPPKGGSAIKSLCPTEEQEQSILVGFLDFAGVLYCHVPNGGYRHPVAGAKFKKMGVKRGVPDILIFTPPPKEPGRVGVAVEMKRVSGSSKATKDQERFIQSLEEAGWVAFVAKGAFQAIERLKGLGY